MSREPAHIRANIARLTIAQALSGANSAVIFSTGAIVGSTLAPDPALATAPITSMTIGMALGTLPAGYIARVYGRRTAFLAGAACGMAAGLLAATAVVVGSFALFCLATLAAGLYATVVQSFRFAAADGVSPAFRPKAVSWVMVGGVFAGLLGPQLVTWTMDLWHPYLFAASYLVQTLVAGLAAVVLAGVDLPRPSAADSALGTGRPLLQIVAQPRFLAAAVCGAVAYALMNFVMTSAPLAMRLCGLPIATSNSAIVWHIVSMYGPSFFTGALITRFGAATIVIAGLALTCGAAAVNLTGLSTTHFISGLALLGLGWNFSFIGASALVLETHQANERTKVQAFNDFLVFGTVAVGSFSSGEILIKIGWAAVNWTILPAIALALLVLAVTRVTRLPDTADSQRPRLSPEMREVTGLES